METTETPETQETPETIEISETKETQETPETKETKETPETPGFYEHKSSSIIDEKICYICDCGSEKILDNYQFNECHHYYCVLCLFRNIFIEHINELIEQNEITIKCKCNKGKIRFTLKEIDDILEFKSKINEKNEKYIQMCKLHDSKCNLFCKKCQKYICYHCKSNHESHKIVLDTIYVRMYKDFIKGMPLKFKYSENFKLNLDKSFDKFNKDLTEKTSSVIKEIDELIDKLISIKKNYILKLKEIQENGLQSMNLITSFYREYYYDLEKIDSDYDIFSLRYLASYKKELDEFEMKYHIGIFPKLEEIRNQIDTFKSLTENPFSLKMKYVDIPTTFREIIRTIGHEGPINCLSRIGDSQFISGSSDNSIKFWNLEDAELKPYECINKYTGEIGCILLLKDNRLCYTCLKDSWIKISEKIKTFTKGDEIKNSEDKYKVANTLSEHTKSVTGLIQLDNNNLVSASRDDKIIVWQMVQDNFIKSFEMKDVHHCNDEKSGVYSLCKLDNNNFISGGADGNIKFWENINKNEYKCIQEFGEHKDKVRNLVLLKDDYLCSASDDGFVKVWTKKDKKYQLYWEKEIKDELITCLAGLENGILITGSSSKNHGIYANMRVWEKIGNEYCLKENIKKHLKKITAVMELDWGNVVSTGEDGVIIIWKSGVLYD